MSRGSSCPQCGRAACASLCLLMGVAASPARSRAQPTPRHTTAVPTPIESMASVVIGPMFMVDPARPLLVESPNSVERCSPLSCFRGDLVARSNTRWQLQLRVMPGSLIASPVSWSPIAESAQPLSDQWVTIAFGTQPTAGTPVPLRIAVGGATAQRPSAAQLSAALEYRLVPLP